MDISSAGVRMGRAVLSPEADNLLEMPVPMKSEVCRLRRARQRRAWKRPDAELVLRFVRGP